MHCPPSLNRTLSSGQGLGASLVSSSIRKTAVVLPSLQALCIAPGEQLGFEYEFINSSSSARWFEVDLGSSVSGGVSGTSGGSSSGSSGGGAAATISLVSGEAQWIALEQASRLAGGQRECLPL